MAVTPKWVIRLFTVLLAVDSFIAQSRLPLTIEARALFAYISKSLYMHVDTSGLNGAHLNPRNVSR